MKFINFLGVFGTELLGNQRCFHCLAFISRYCIFKRSILRICRRMGKSGKKRPTEQTLDQPAYSKHKVITDGVTAAGPGCSRVGLAKFLSSLHQNGVLDSKTFGEEFSERSAKRGLTNVGAKLCATQTPYGALIQSMELPLEDEKMLLRYINPFGFLHYLSQESAAFGRIIANKLKNQTNSVIIYFDETRPGNVLRPDYGRQVLAVYWTFKELPEHVRSRSVGWFPFTFVRSEKITRLPGKVSNFAARILRIFFSEGFNMSVGVRCIVKNEDVFVRAKFCGIVGDEKALKEAYRCYWSGWH